MQSASTMVERRCATTTDVRPAITDLTDRSTCCSVV